MSVLVGGVGHLLALQNAHCIGGLGGFGGLFELDCTGYKHPVLILSLIHI